jgi:hypothetical protein
MVESAHGRYCAVSVNLFKYLYITCGHAEAKQAQGCRVRDARGSEHRLGLNLRNATNSIWLYDLHKHKPIQIHIKA